MPRKSLNESSPQENPLPPWTPIPHGLTEAQAYSFIETNFALLYEAIRRNAAQSLGGKQEGQPNQQRPPG